jgi:hypothetical protein
MSMGIDVEKRSPSKILRSSASATGLAQTKRKPDARGVRPRASGFSVSSSERRLSFWLSLSN